MPKALAERNKNFARLAKTKKICRDFYASPQQSADKTADSLLTVCYDAPYLIPSVANEIFRFYDVAPHTGSVVRLLFNVCEKAAFTLPYDSFAYSMKMVEEFPRCLIKGSHPEYVYQPSEQHTFEQCPICGGNGTPFFRAFTYNIANFCYPHLPFKLWMKCSACGNMYAWKQPRAWLAMSDTSETVYPRQGYEHFSATQEKGAHDTHIWGKVLRTVSQYTEGNNLLEIGVGTGAQLATALELGFNVSGVEIDDKVARKVADMLNIPIWRGDFLKFSSEELYSVVIMGDVIEHIIDPQQALRNVYNILADDGVLWLSTPNFDSGYSRMMKFNDFMWCVQNHVTYFSYDGFKKLAKDCGFVVREYNVSERYAGSMELILTKKM